MGGLVDLVQVRTLLAVHLDVDEEPVHDRRRGRVLEGLVGHDVAPVAGGVTDGEQDGPVGLAGQGQGLVAPGPPVHRIVGVLEQVGAGGGSEAVGLGGCQGFMVATCGGARGRRWAGDGAQAVDRERWGRCQPGLQSPGGPAGESVRLFRLPAADGSARHRSKHPEPPCTPPSSASTRIRNAAWLPATAGSTATRSTPRPPR